MNRLRVPSLAASTAATAHLVQILAFRLAGLSSTRAFFVFHLLLLFAIFGAVAWVCRGRRGGRWTTALLVALPVALAATPRSLSEGEVGWGYLVLLLSGTGIAVWLWARARWAPSSPLIAAVAGSGAAACLLEFRFGSGSVGLVLADMWPVVLLTLVATGGLVVGAVRSGGLGGWARPGPRTSIAIAVLAVAVSVPLCSFVPRLRLPPDPAAEVEAPEETGPPIVLIVLDAVRADHLRRYGYDRDTMPGLERLVDEEAVTVETAIANSPWSLPTHASIFTGLYPPRHGAHAAFVTDPSPPTVGYGLRREVETLPARLRRSGYWTVALSANYGPLDREFGLARGFALYRTLDNPVHTLKLRTPWCRVVGFLRAGVTSTAGADVAILPVGLRSCGAVSAPDVPYRRASRISEEALRVVERAGDRSFFLFLNYFDAHAPYAPPPGYVNTFQSPDTPAPADSLDELEDDLLTGERELRPVERRYWRTRYDAELRYLDGQLRRLLDGLRAHPRWEEMLVVITSDHGEAFGEHGFMKHSLHLYEELLRVPLFVKPGSDTPDLPAPGTVLPGPRQSVDLFPLMLRHAGLPVPEGIDGVPWDRRRAAAFAWSYRVAAYEHDPARFERELVAVRRDGWKLIVGSAGQRWLFNLREDPAERRDLTGRGHAVEAELADLARRYVGLAAERRAEVAASKSRKESREVIDRLRALGYVR